MRRRPQSPTSAPTAIVLAAIVVAGFVLRLVAMQQSLFGDERYTYAIVTQNGLRGVWHEVYTTSITPPFHYALAWASVQLGDPTVLVRLPSLLLGTATIGLVFLLGRRIGGPRTGLVAAGLMAFSPFAIFYGSEARAYATAVFLVALSTWALLRAMDEDGSPVWWGVYSFRPRWPCGPTTRRSSCSSPRRCGRCGPVVTSFARC